MNDPESVIELMIELAPNVAKLQRKLYKEAIKQGFSKKEAFVLTSRTTIKV